MRTIATKEPSNDSAKQKKNGDRVRSRSISPLSTGMPLLQRQCACGGGCPRCQEKLGIQTKLKISEPGDKYEQEADRIADEVMRMPEPVVQRQIEPEEEEEERVQRKAITNQITPLVQRQVLPEMEEEEEVIQTKTIDNQAALSAPTQESSEVPPTVHEVLRSPGQPLDPATRAFMEPRFGHDFSRVRVHSDAAAEQSAREVNANAYTVGHNVVFGAGQFAPGTHEGWRLIAHELTHVVQQSGSDGIRLDQSDDKRGLSPILSSAPALPEFSINHFVNGNFANFDAQYDVMGPVPATGTLFISNRVHMNYPKSMTKDEQTTFENDFVKSVHDKWSNKYLLTLNEPGFSPYQCNVDVTSHIEKDPDNAHTVINVVKPKLSKKRFHSRVSGIDKKKNSETTQKAKLDFRDPTIEEQKKINEADFIRDVGNFDFDSDKINNDCQEDIDKITDFIKQNATQQDPNVCTFSLQYTGRASSQGDKFYNKKLSERRIKSVDKILESLPGLCLSISVAAGEEEATEDAEFRRVSVGVFLENSQKPKNATQNVAAHEFGHMIGLGDEYVETVPEIPGSRAKFFGDKPTHYDLVKSIIDDTAADELIIQDSSNIMARGNDVKRGHYVFFVAAIDIMTRPEIQKATGKPDAKWNVI